MLVFLVAEAVLVSVQNDLWVTGLIDGSVCACVQYRYRGAW